MNRMILKKIQFCFTFPYFSLLLICFSGCSGRHKGLAYCCYMSLSKISFPHSMLFYFTDIKVYIYLCTFLCVYILLLLSCFGCSKYILLISITSSLYVNHTIYSYKVHSWKLYNIYLAADVISSFGPLFLKILLLFSNLMRSVVYDKFGYCNYSCYSIL